MSKKKGKPLTYKVRNPVVLRKASTIIQDKREKEATLRHQQEMSKWVNIINDLRKESKKDE